MTHAERLALIHRPFFIRYIGRSYPWSGVLIGDRFPTGRNGESLLYDDDGNRITGFRVFQVDVDALAEADADPDPLVAEVESAK